jgi:hypothetical protein
MSLKLCIWSEFLKLISIVTNICKEHIICVLYICLSFVIKWYSERFLEELYCMKLNILYVRKL